LPDKFLNGVDNVSYKTALTDEVARKYRIKCFKWR